MIEDQKYMRLAFGLAKKGLSAVAPNPMVGCVIVKNGLILGTGYHQKYGQPHAEPNAVNSIPDKKDIEGSDIYVTLEPCAHFGKTPPCADLLVSLKPKRVIIANVDSNPLVGGKGILKLRNAGIEVVTGILEKEGRELNKRFFTFIEQKRPYIFLKWAQSKDGFIGTEDKKAVQISGQESMSISHQMRASESAILVGFTTALNDNPTLTTRLVAGKSPLRMYIDKRLELPKSHNLLDESTPTLCFNALKNEVSENIEYIQLTGGDFVKQILDILYKKSVASLIVEGGSNLIQHFIDQNLWDEALVFESKAMLNNGVIAPKVKRIYPKSEALGEDTLLFYKA